MNKIRTMTAVTLASAALLAGCANTGSGTGMSETGRNTAIAAGLGASWVIDVVQKALTGK